MCFEQLAESAGRGELLLIAGGLCHYHLRRDGQLTIREIVSTRKGAGREMLAHLRAVPGALALFARCPADLPSNAWYAAQGFVFEGAIRAKSGRIVNAWRLGL